MKIAVLVIGNEILNGKIQDKNAYYLANTLRERGVTLKKVFTCGDDKNDILNALNYLYAQVDTVITSGGLGPTIDDITQEAIADFFKEEICFHQMAQNIAIENYKRRGRDYFDSPKTYENFINSAIPLNNPAGMAPGIKLQKENKTIFALPGVPTEFKAIFLESVLPILKTDNEITHFICRTKFTPESKLYSMLQENINDYAKFGELSFLPHPTHVDIGITLTKTREQNAKDSETLKKMFLNSAIKDLIWHFGPESLEEVIIKTAIKNKQTIALAESCTGGLNAHRLTNVSGSSETFLGSVVSYANSVKEGLVHVKNETLKAHGAVSKETAIEMAKGARNAMKADIAVSTTGIAGPGGGSMEKPVGTVWVGISLKDKVEAFHFHFHGDRDELKTRFSNAALFKLLEAMVAVHRP